MRYRKDKTSGLFILASWDDAKIERNLLAANKEGGVKSAVKFFVYVLTPNPPVKNKNASREERNLYRKALGIYLKQFGFCPKEVGKVFTKLG